MGNNRFPTHLYRLVPALYPHFAAILAEAKVTGPEFFVLSYVKNAGKEIGPGVIALPLSELTSVLIKVGAYDSRSGAAGFIAGLEDHPEKGFLRHARISHEQKRSLFPKSTGYRDVVVITDAGQKALARVNQRVEALFARVVAGVPRIYLRPLLSAFDRTADKICARLDELSGV